MGTFSFPSSSFFSFLLRSEINAPSCHRRSNHTHQHACICHLQHPSCLYRLYLRLYLAPSSRYRVDNLLNHVIFSHETLFLPRAFCKSPAKPCLKVINVTLKHNYKWIHFHLMLFLINERKPKMRASSASSGAKKGTNKIKGRS